MNVKFFGIHWPRWPFGISCFILEERMKNRYRYSNQKRKSLDGEFVFVFFFLLLILLLMMTTMGYGYSSARHYISSFRKVCNKSRIAKHDIWCSMWQKKSEGYYYFATKIFNFCFFFANENEKLLKINMKMKSKEANIKRKTVFFQSMKLHSSQKHLFLVFKRWWWGWWWL